MAPAGRRLRRLSALPWARGRRDLLPAPGGKGRRGPAAGVDLSLEPHRHAARPVPHRFRPFPHQGRARGDAQLPAAEPLRGMTQFRYAIVDVFAEAPLQGNPAAIVFDADALDSARMQAIAREFNLSETAFILKPQDGTHTAHVRIFTPMSEVPFAGHPNIGAAFALANDRPLRGDDLVFEEKAGLVRLQLDRLGERVIGASLTAPQTLSTQEAPGVTAVAAALSLQESEIVTRTHPPIVASVGLDFMFVEVGDIAA